MNDIFLDTSYCIALAYSVDVHRGSSGAWSRWVRLTRPRIHCHDGILIEVGDGFAQRFGAGVAASVVRGVLTDPLTVRHPISSGLLDRAVEFQEQYADKQWGLTDCISFVLMREHEWAAALTADRHFTQAGFRALLHEDPPT